MARGSGSWPSSGGRLPDPKTVSEVTGTFLDVGRLERTELPQLGDLAALSQRVVNKPGRGSASCCVLLVDGAADAAPLAAPSVRTLALDPDRYLDQEVTVVGRFRGRNLYGDLPTVRARAAGISSCSRPTPRSG